jgi:hypothetical protein
MGSTSISTPAGGSIDTLYTASGWPTLVTVLDTVSDDLRLGMAIDGRFKSNKELSVAVQLPFVSDPSMQLNNFW